MKKTKSFVAADFSFSDIPIFIIGFAILSVLCVAAGFVFQSIPPWFDGKLPPFLYGMACGFGVSLLLGMWMMSHKPTRE